MNPFPFTFDVDDLSEVDRSKLNWYYKRYAEEFYNEYHLGHFLLAAYASVPAFITPDLLYKLWQNFNGYKLNGKPVSIHRIAVADLLLSPLCREAGYELYEMDHQVRLSFLEWLKNEGTTDLWKKRQVREINDIAKFVEAYHLLPNPAGKRWGADYIETQTLEAVSYYNPEIVTDKLFNKLRTASVPFKETELLYTMDMFIKTKERLDKIAVPMNLSNNEQKQSDWMYAWKAFIEQNKEGFIDRLNKDPGLYDLFNDTQSGVEVTISKGMIKKLNFYSERKLRALVVGVNEKLNYKRADDDLNSALLFEEMIRGLAPASELELVVLTGKEATCDAILKKWKAMIDDTRPNDDLLFYISSNGLQVDDHCYVTCYDSSGKDKRVAWLVDQDIGDAAKSVTCNSVTVFAQVDHAATPYWLDISKPGNVVFASCKFQQPASNLSIEDGGKKYCAFTYAFTKAVQGDKVHLSNRYLFLNAFREYTSRLSQKKGALEKKLPQLICSAGMYDHFFLRGETSTVELQNLLRSNGYLDGRTTGTWNKKTAVALAEYIETARLSKELTKQEYIIELRKSKEHLQKRLPVFLLIFSDPKNILKSIVNEKNSILESLSGSGLEIERVVLDHDVKGDDLINVLTKKEYRDRIEFIYFSGKDNDGSFELKDGAFSFLEFAELLDYQENVKLFVSNTCRSHQFAEYTTQLGVGISIGVEGVVEDRLAAEFGIKLFQLIGEGYDIMRSLDDFEQLLSTYNHSNIYRLYKAAWQNNAMNWHGKRSGSQETYALIVAVNSYKEAGLPSLKGNVEDAIRFRDWLVQTVPQENISLLISSGAEEITQDRIDNVLARFVFETRKDGDRKRLLLGYFAGCGIDSDGGPLLLLDGWTPTFRNRCINIGSYRSVLQQASAIDGICFFYDFQKVHFEGVSGVLPSFIPSQDHAPHEASWMMAGVFSSDPGSEKLEGPAQARFTAALMEGLSGHALDRNGNITFRSIRDFLLNKQMGIVQQEPFVTLSGNQDFIISANKLQPFQKVEIRFSKNHLDKTVTISDARLNKVFDQKVGTLSVTLDLQPGLYRLEIPGAGLVTSFDIALSNGIRIVDFSWKFLEKWVWILGSAYDLSDIEIKTAKAVGKFIAEQGYGLVTGGWPGVDYLAAEAYYDTLRSFTEITDIDTTDYLVHFIETGKKSDYNNGVMHYVSSQEWARSVTAKSFAAISIGGQGGTYELFQYARSNNFPFIPLPLTMGDSIRAYGDLSESKRPGIPADLLSNLGAPVSLATEDYLPTVEKILIHLAFNNNPYRGLLAYTNKQADIFYGRTRLLTGWNEHGEKFIGLEELIKTYSVVCITGPSGSGKTSFVNAALYNFLMPLTIAIKVSEIVYVKPGAKPLEIIDRLETSPPRPVILIIDQYEELETLASVSHKKQFEKWLEQNVAISRLIILLRSDFEDKFMSSPVIGMKRKRKTRQSSSMRNPKASRFEIPEFSREEIQEIVVRPVEKLNLKYRSIDGTQAKDDEFVDNIIDDAYLRPWSIPYLSAILHELVERKQGNELLESVYRELGGIVGVQNNIEHVDFETAVERLYNTKKITVADDLQKDRWGGRPVRNGKRLSAKVTHKTSGNFQVTLIAEAVTAGAMNKQKIAFFLHDSFADEIEYKTFNKNKAQYIVSAYEAFTAAAYFEDGTMLELDLNEQTGYPAQFYYTDVSKTFKDEVKKMYAERPVTVKDDLQKNRWGGRNIVNDKVLRAEVKKAAFPGYFRITIRLSSQNPNAPLIGDLAFFIHDTFSNDIMYRKAIKGEAKINITAYEAFTVGAFTKDGTMLELDLNEVRGFPDKFYY